MSRSTQRRCFGYICSKSSDDLDAIEIGEEMIEEWVIRNNHVIVGIFSDDYVAECSYKDQPQLSHILQQMEENDIFVVPAYESIGLTFIEFTRFRENLDSRKCGFAMVKESLDSRSASGRHCISYIAAWHQLQIDLANETEINRLSAEEDEIKQEGTFADNL